MLAVFTPSATVLGCKSSCFYIVSVAGMASLQVIAKVAPVLARRAMQSPLARQACAQQSRRLHSSVLKRQTAGSTVAASTATEFVRNHEPVPEVINTANFIDNEFRPSQTSTWFDVHDPATNNVVTRVPQTTDAELQAAVDSAAKAFPGWKATSVLTRQQAMFKYVGLIRQHWDRLAASITLEQGKTFADAKGDVLRGLQVAEVACGITTQLTGEVLEVAKDMETRSYKEPLGVVASICPFSEPSVASVVHVHSHYQTFPPWSLFGRFLSRLLLAIR